jgi:hypothetical protein
MNVADVFDMGHRWNRDRTRCGLCGEPAIAGDEYTHGHCRVVVDAYEKGVFL